MLFQKAQEKKSKSTIGMISKGLNRLTTKNSASTDDDGLNWDDTVVVEFLEGPEPGGPGKYRLSQVPYQSSGLTSEERSKKAKEDEMKVLKEKKEAEMLGMYEPYFILFVLCVLLPFFIYL